MALQIPSKVKQLSRAHNGVSNSVEPAPGGLEDKNDLRVLRDDGQVDHYAGFAMPTKKSGRGRRDRS